MNFMKLATVTTAIAMLISCGGGGDSPAVTATASSVSDDNRAQIAATSEKEAPDNPAKVGPAFSTDARRSGRPGEHRKEGDATAPTIVPDHLKAPKPEKRVKIQAVGDPIQRPMGETVAVAPDPTAIPRDAATKGMWSQIYDWPLIPIHMGMMPDGRIMSFGTNEGGRQTGKTIYAIFDPSKGLFDGHTIYPKTSFADIFCGAMLFLPLTNEMLTVGGDNLIPDPNDPPGFTNNTGNNSSTIYTPSTNTMVAGKNMALPRWYATNTTLANGTTFVMGGLGGEAYPELRQANGNWKSLTGANTSNLDYWYPRNFLAANGRIFGYDSYGNYYNVTTTGTGAITILGQWDVDAFGEAGSAAVYAPGKILQLAAYTNRANIINFTAGANPTITPTAPMEQRRQNVSAVTLPNGKVVATGGSAVYNEIGPDAGVYLKASIWDPATGQWTQSNPTPSGIARLYHSIAMLQPDGTVLVGGGGAWGPLSNLNIEFYYPPYLFNGTQLAVRPKVTQAPTVMELGATIKFTVDDAAAPITKVSIMKAPATTHSLNMDQAFSMLTFTRNGNEITAQLPTEVAYATPGYYMLFAMTANDTPSQARMIRMNIPNSVTNPPTALTATYAAATGVTLKWTQSTSTGLKSNIISRAPAATGPWTDLADVTPRTTYVTPPPGTGVWYYAVKAVGSTGNPSLNSNVATVTIGTTPPPTLTVPTAPTGFTGSYATATGITLRWTNPTATATMPAVTTNTVYRGTAAAGPFTELTTIPVTTTWTDNMQVAGTYYYQVVASNSVGTSLRATSAGITVTPPVQTTVNPPTALSGYTCGADCWTTDTGVRINWTASTTTTVTGYTIQRATAQLGPFATVATLGKVAVFVDKNVTNGTTYYYQVAAVSGASTSPYAALAYGITSNISLGTGTPAVTTTANVTATPTNPTVGQAISFGGSTSTPATGATIAGYSWAITTPGAGAAFTGPINLSVATVNTTSAGTFTVSLTVTDNQGGTNTKALAVVVTAAPTGTEAGPFAIQSQEQTKYLVMNWWRGDPVIEGDFRQPGICTGAASQGGNCYLGARKTFRPQAFNIATTPTAVAGLIVMDVPQFTDGVKTYDHYRLPIEFVKTGCTFKVQHVRRHNQYEFPLAPPGLEILDHKFTLTQAMCDAYPTGAMTQAWLNTLNTALTAYLGPKVAYAPEAYPYNDPRTGKDPSQP